MGGRRFIAQKVGRNKLYSTAARPHRVFRAAFPALAARKGFDPAGPDVQIVTVVQRSPLVDTNPALGAYGGPNKILQPRRYKVTRVVENDEEGFRSFVPQRGKHANHTMSFGNWRYARRVKD